MPLYFSSFPLQGRCPVPSNPHSTLWWVHLTTITHRCRSPQRSVSATMRSSDLKRCSAQDTAQYKETFFVVIDCPLYKPGQVFLGVVGMKSHVHFLKFDVCIYRPWFHSKTCCGSCFIWQNKWMQSTDILLTKRVHCVVTYLTFTQRNKKKEDFHHVIRFSVQEENFMISFCALALPQMHVHVGKRDDGSVQAQV